MASLPSAPSSPACLRVARGVGPLPLPPNARSWCHRTCRHPGAWDGQPFKHACSSLGTDDGGLDEGLQTGSEAWRNRPAAISLPEHAQTPESWFVLAIFLKVVVFGAMWPNQLFLLVPVAVGLMLMTKYILNRNLHRRPRFAPLFVLCCAAVLFLLRAFA